MSADALAIRISGLRKSFGAQVVLDGIDVELARGETLTVLGRSGTGKSVLLKLIVGLQAADAGSIQIGGQAIGGLPLDRLNAIRKTLGFLFQQAALYDSLTVEENVAFPLRRHTELPDDERARRVRELLSRMGMERDLDKLPADISGGMKKRVGLARALALDPELLFSDEPTSGLDPIMTAVVDKLTLELTKDAGMTAVVVTHDMTSAFRIASRMIMLGRGRILAQGTPDEIRTHPDPEVQQFINGEPDSPMPLNLSQDDHADHQHVKARPLVAARRRFHHKMP